MPSDHPPHGNVESHNVTNRNNLTINESVKYPITVKHAQNRLRLLQYESRTLNEILNILKQRLDEVRDTGNKEDLAQVWTKYHMQVRELEQQIEDHTVVIATHHIEHTQAVHTTRLNDRLARLTQIINAMLIQMEASV